MTNALGLLVLSGLIAAISACSVNSTSVIGTRWATTTDKLASGKIVKIGMLKPTPAWGCLKLDQQSFKWSSLQFQGQFTSLNGGYGVLRAKVVKYANDQNLNTNYVYFTIPETTTLNGFNLSAMADTDNVNVTYYQCSKVGV